MSVSAEYSSAWRLGTAPPASFHGYDWIIEKVEQGCSTSPTRDSFGGQQPHCFVGTARKLAGVRTPEYIAKLSGTAQGKIAGKSEGRRLAVWLSQPVCSGRSALLPHEAGGDALLGIENLMRLFDGDVARVKSAPASIDSMTG
ncbi:hypothetical protein VTO42DRAFT_4173 [Malbranchea cinnamomea]